MRGTTPLDTTKFAAARLIALDVQPFLGAALFALTPVIDDTRGTFAVDSKFRLFVDPTCLAKWSVKEVAGVLLHEVGHVVRDHAGRATAAQVDLSNHALWNVAADAEINDDLRDDRVLLPGTPVYPERLRLPKHRVAEFYFSALSKAGKELEIPNCGPGCHGVDDDRGSTLAGLPAGLTEVDLLLLRKQVAEAVLALPLGQRPGDGAGGWTRWAEATLQPQIEWRHLLQGAIRGAVGSAAGAADYSYAKPSRRTVPRVVLPSLRRALPSVAIVIDTSASVSAVALNQAWAETLNCLRHLGVRRDLLSVFAVDAVAQRIKRPHAARAALGGGGGTDMSAGIEAACRQRPIPNLIVVITDGYTPWPSQPPRTRVVIALLASRSDIHVTTPEWATTVVVDVDESASPQ